MMPPGEIPCPRCRRPTTWVDNDNRPFCSERCRLLDLGAWVEESYRIPDSTPLSDDEKIDNVI
jgi:endogenous inhibitor of DNA gyrase (YacG/DUF329 family)